MYKAIMSTLKLPLEGRGLPNRRKPLIRHRGQNSTSRCSLDSVLHNSLSLETARNSCSRHKSQMLPPFSASPSSLELASFDLVLVASSRPPPRILLSFSCCLCPLVTEKCPPFSPFSSSLPRPRFPTFVGCRQVSSSSSLRVQGRVLTRRLSMTSARPFHCRGQKVMRPLPSVSVCPRSLGHT